MNRRTALALAALAVPAVLLPATAATAVGGKDADGDEGRQVFRSMLLELNDSGATGTAMLRLDGRELTVRIKARGLVPNQVHAQHIHGKGSSECPPPSADKTGDGLVSVVEGVPFYGPIVTSLTTNGDTSSAAGLSLAAMPVADDRGRIDYRRTITLPKEASADLEDYQVVQHGIDVNGNGAYDFSAGVSDIAPGVAFELTAPANCGAIEHAGHGHAH